MRALVLHAANDLRLEDRADPGPPGPGQVRVKMAAGGICGSDLHYYQHGGFGTIRVREPIVLGHEVAGHVEALGEGVTGLSEGQLVAVSPSRPCGTCRFCKEGMFNQCLNMRFYGSAMPMPHIQGAFRDVVLADAAQCVPADGLTPAQAAMAEPLAVCLHATARAGSLVGKSVLVTGCGPIGLLSILCARRAGADLVVATDLAEMPLATARKLGADEALTAGPDALAPWTAEKGQFDVLFECSGVEPALRAGVDALRPGGTILQLGLGGDMTLPLQAITAKELALKGSFRFHGEFATAVSLMRKGLIDVDPLLSATMPPEDHAAAFALAADRSRALKVQFAF
ncbi:MAG: L-idonate 5-dehydrogenase [Pseudomonadota bacterium]